jgi:hypothetical protein
VIPPGTDPRIVLVEQELTRVRRLFESALDSVAPDRLHRAPEGQWTPAQLVWHCAKVERGVARLIERLDAAIPEMATVPPGPSPAKVLHILDHIPYHDRTQKRVAPEPIRPPGTVDLEAERARLADGRAQLTDAMHKAGPRLSLMKYEHLLFGPFDGWQWVLSVAKHEERHVAQMHEVAAARL